MGAKGGCCSFGEWRCTHRQKSARMEYNGRDKGQRYAERSPRAGRRQIAIRCSCQGNAARAGSESEDRPGPDPREDPGASTPWIKNSDARGPRCLTTTFSTVHPRRRWDWDHPLQAIRDFIEPALCPERSRIRRGFLGAAYTCALHSSSPPRSVGSLHGHRHSHQSES